MKTFRTTGTGNEQTLSEIESDKIPIYPSVQDIESDLANLEEGQIVATPDTGNEVAQPVDVVEKDNLHAVTSNAVSESLSYSTTEQKTGGKWIDGRPIYRQVFTGRTVPSTGWTNTGHTVTNGDVIISSFTYNSTTKAITSAFSYRFNNNDLQSYSANSYANYDTIILEYTKTTD